MSLEQFEVKQQQALIQKQGKSDLWHYDVGFLYELKSSQSIFQTFDFAIK